MYVAIGAGGALGGLARWAAEALLPHQTGHFPWSTFLVNTVGSFLLGLLMVFLLDVWPPSRYARPFLAVGVLGGFTTFSTYMLEARALLAQGQVALAAAYVLATLSVGLGAVWMAVVAGRRIVRHHHAPRRRGLR